MQLSWDVLILLSILSFLVYWYFTRNFNYWKNKDVPYEKPRFFFGNLIELFFGNETPGKYLETLYNKFEGPYFGIFALNQPQLVLRDPQIIKNVLIKDFQSFPNRPVYCNEKIDPMFGSSLAAIKSPLWKPLRAKLSPIFTSGKMKLMFVLMNECGENLKEYVNGLVGKEDIEIKEVTAKFTTDVIATCAFGINSNSFVTENSEFIVAGRRMFQRSLFGTLQSTCYFFAPMLVKFFRFKFIDAKAAAFLRQVFMDTIHQRETLKNKRNDLIDILIDLKNKEVKDDEFKFYGDRLVSQAIVFFGAGHEATSSTIAFTLHELCINLDIQNRVRKEILDVIERHGDLTYEAVQDMKYLDMVVAEILRKYPLTAFLQRECDVNYKIPETGLVLEKGTPILIPLYGLQWDPKYFPKPDQFDPERFSDENKHKIPSGVYLPFGDGPRNCIGERFALVSSKLGIIHILRNFKVERNVYTKDVFTFGRSSLLQPKGGIRLTFQPL